MRTLACLLVLAAARVAGGQPVCDTRTAPGATMRVPLPDGYAVELHRQPDTLAVEDVCTATIRDAHGAVVWSADGFGARLDPWTGHDIDGDGHPDAVLGLDTGGGNRCCWTYHVLRFTPAFAVAASLPFVPRFKQDAAGRTLIEEVVSFYDLGRDMADAPTMTRVLQWRGGVLRDVTRDHCHAMLADTAAEWAPATPARRDASRRAATVTDDVQQTRDAVGSLVLQTLLCGHPTAARRLVRDTWPAALSDQEWKTLRPAARTRARARP